MKKILSEYLTDIKLITRNIKLFLVGGLLLGLLMGLMQLLLNLYLKDIGYGEAFIGRVLSLAAVGGLVAAIPVAYLVARYPIKPILIGSSILLSAFFLILCTTRWEWLILFSSFCVGLFMTVKNVASAPFIMRNSTERERTLIFSLNYSTWIVAAIIGSLGGGWLHDLAFRLTNDTARSYQIPLGTAAVFGLSAVIPFLFIKGKAPHPDEVSKTFSWTSVRSKGPLFLKLTMPYFLLGAGAGLIIPFLNLYFRDRFGLDPARIGVYFSILSFTMLVAVLMVPILKRRIGYINTVMLTELLSIPFMLILCYTDNLQLAFWAFLLRGALMNMGAPVVTTFMMETVNKEDHGLINSLASIAWGSVWAISTQVAGVMIEESGFVRVFLIAIVLYLASAGSYYYFFSRCERRDGERIIIETSRIR